MLRLLKRPRKSDPPHPARSPAPPSPPSASSVTASPVTPAAREESPVERRDSDEFFSAAVQELDGNDFLLSPAKVTVADINSIQEASPPSGSRQWARSLQKLPQSATGSSSPPESQYHQRTRSGSSGGGGGGSRSLFSASEDDQSWLVAAPAGNGKASPSDFMLEDSPPRRAMAAGAFSASPTRIPSRPSPSASTCPGQSRIPKPASNYASPVKSGGSGASGSRIPASPTPSSSAASRIPASPSPAYSEERPVQQYPESPSRLPKGPAASSQGVQEPPAALEPLRPFRDYSDDLQPAAQAAEPYVEPAPASPRADVPYGEPYLPQSMLQSPAAAQAAPPQQRQSDQPEPRAQQQAPDDSGEWTGVAVGEKRPAKESASAAAAEQKPQRQNKPNQQQQPQKEKQCCGCCIM